MKKGIFGRQKIKRKNWNAIIYDDEIDNDKKGREIQIATILVLVYYECRMKIQLTFKISMPK
jgi:hypothetical protein